MKKHKTIFDLLVLVTTLLFIFPFSFVYAADPVPTTTPDGYVVLVPLPGIEGGKPTDLSTYLPAIFNLAIGIAAALAFIMIVWGGVQYATSDAITGKAEGKGIIENAVWGLILVIGAYIILWTINPQILNINILLPKAKVDAPPAGAIVAPPMTKEQVTESNRIADLLGQTHNPCNQGTTRGCVNFNGLQPQVISAMNALSKSCSLCAISITGGTEGNHSTGSLHAQGRAVDISPNRAWESKVTNGKTPNACEKFSYGGGTYMWEPAKATCGGDAISSGDHWHVSF